MASTGVNVARWSALGLGVIYGIYHQQSIRVQDRLHAARQDIAHKQNMINQAKAEFQRSTQSPSESDKGPVDPKEDLGGFPWSSISRSLWRVSYSASRPLITSTQPVSRLFSSIAIKPTQLTYTSIIHQRRLFSDEASSPPIPPAGRPLGWEIKPSTTLYVGNLFFDVKDSDINEFFSKWGQIEETKIISDIRGFSKGFAFVTFANEADAKAACEGGHGELLAGRRLAVNYAAKRPTESRAPNTPSPTLFIGNLSYDITDRELNALFRPLKDIRDVRVAIDRRTGQPRGFAHADFTNVESAVQAKERLNGTVIRDREIKLDFSHSSRNAAAYANHLAKSSDQEGVENAEQEAQQEAEQKNEQKEASAL